MRGKNYLGIGGVSMGIIGSDVRRNTLLQYFGMGSVSVDMGVIRGRIDRGFYDHEECEKAFKFMKQQLQDSTSAKANAPCRTTRSSRNASR